MPKVCGFGLVHSERGTMHVSHLSRRSFIEAAALAAGGGETISIVLGTRPELYRRALHTISRWDGDIETLAAAEVPVYMAIGENDDYYGSGPAREAYEEIRAAYRARRLSEERISELVVLDVKPTSYFTERGFAADAGQHGAGGYLFARDEDIMGWLFS